MIILISEMNIIDFSGSFIKSQTSGTSSDNEWYNEWQRMTTSGTTSDNEWQRVTTSGTTSDNEWQRMTTSGTTSDNEWQPVTSNDEKWQRVAILVKLPFFK